MTTYDLYHNDQMTNFICFELNVERALTLLMVPIFVWMFVRKIWFRVFITLHWTLFKMKNVTSKRKNNSGCKSGYRETFCEKKCHFQNVWIVRLRLKYVKILLTSRRSRQRGKIELFSLFFLPLSKNISYIIWVKIL